MSTCIKCGRTVADGELFCTHCSKSPVIAELAAAEPRPVQQKRPSAPPPVPVAPRPAPKAKTQPPAKPRKGLTAALLVALAVVLGLFLWQQIGLQTEKNRARTMQEEAQRQFLTLEQTQESLTEAQEALTRLEETVKIKDEEIKTLTEKLADSRSTQNQGAYDLSNLEKELTALQEEYDALLEEHDLMVEAVEAASKYKDKAEFLDKYVVFVMNDGSKTYHTYDCESFTHANFWTYSPKLAEAQGFRPCGKCIE